MLRIHVAGKGCPETEGRGASKADHEDEGLEQAQEGVVVAEREGARGSLGDAGEGPPKLVVGDVDDAETRVEAKALVRDELADHLLLDNSHGQVQRGCDLEPSSQAKDRELHREDLFVGVVGVHAHREELSLAETNSGRRVEPVGLCGGLEELPSLLHPTGQNREPAAEGFDDRAALAEHLDEPEKGEEVGVPLADLRREEEAVA